MMTNFWNSLGDILASLLSITPIMGNLPNLLAILVISVLFIWWTRKLMIFKKNGEA
jgi:hypothetical protein